MRPINSAAPAMLVLKLWDILDAAFLLPLASMVILTSSSDTICAVTLYITIPLPEAPNDNDEDIDTGFVRPAPNISSKENCILDDDNTFLIMLLFIECVYEIDDAALDSFRGDCAVVNAVTILE